MKPINAIKKVGELRKKAAPKASGKTYRQMRRRKNILDTRFNNGEPLAVAVRKVTCQLLIIAAVFAAVFGLLVVRSYVTDYLSNDSVFSLTMNSNYKEILLLESVEDYTAEESSGIAAAAAVSTLLGNNRTEAGLAADYEQDPTKFISGMTKFLETEFAGCSITAESNISNYAMMTEIYENLQEGNGIIVSMASAEDEYAIEDDEIIYAVVTGVNFTDDTVTVVTPYGRTETIFTEDFIAKTRFDTHNSMTVLERISFVLGFRGKNCIYFIEKQ